MGGGTHSIYFVADIHGSDVCWRKFLNAAKFYGVDTIIVGGDVTGKALVPLIERRDGRVEARIAGRVQSARSAEEIAELEARVRFNGFYAYRCTEDEYEKLAVDDEHRDEVFERIMADTLRDWLRLADERLHRTGIRALVMPGNDDGWYVDDVLTESAEVINSDGRIVDLGDYQVLGFGPSNRTPWNTHRELDESDIAARLDALLPQVDPAKPVILATHVPPHGVGLDVAPKLREDLSVVIQGGEPVMVPVGSTAVRDFINKAQPMLALHGHIHESRGVAKMGQTIAINPGSAYSTGALYGTIVTLKKGKVVSHQLVTG
jgi:Icc-related predicted phosphoesterase